MKVRDAIKKRRSIRKFKDKCVTYEKLKELILAARMAPSAANRQPLEYLIVDAPHLERKIFPHTHWAGYLDWEPSKEERPRAYILILIEKKKRSNWYKYDVGAAAENICLSAVANGLGTCLVGAIDRKRIRSILNVPETKRIDLAIAIGYPAHESTVDEAEGDIKYWMDEQGKFHVPKRTLEQLLHRNRFA
ncbi:MAG: nitroreductase [Candidatus Korarchaeota archaeon]|nr:nitroreductase [Candidatus Korarchaeota archaeon]NIU85377.1 nitroreductase [Candidatus Thorarchaeota archaeon]NIW15475.1 nitroreductase [Candidatus Thorarchaeota archaeon]NIW53419.1 nitroreductase [Candidatus Korarchaeota archaeon]